MKTNPFLPALSIFTLLITPALATPGQWSPGASLTKARSSPQALLLNTGEVFLVGGHSGTTSLADTEIYNPANDTWAAATSMLTARYGAAMVLLQDGRVLTLGGYDASKSAEFYTPDANGGMWNAAATAATYRTYPCATLLADGRVFLVGGAVSTNTPLAEIFAPGPNQWDAADPTANRTFSTATTLADGRVLVVGGIVSGTVVAWAYIYTPGTLGQPGSWASAPFMKTPRQSHTATLLADGRVLVVGGASSQVNLLASAEIFDPAANAGQGAWTTLPLINARDHHTATLLADGRVLVAGGRGNGDGGVGFKPLASTEIIDPAAGQSTATDDLAEARFNHAAVRLPGGKVLVAGGYSGFADLASVEIYEPAPAPAVEPGTATRTLPTSVTVGQTFAVQVDITPVSGVSSKQLVETLPSNVTVVDNGGGTQNGNTLTWTSGNGNQTVTYQLKATAAGTLNFSGVYTTNGGGNVTVGGNTSTVATVVAGTVAKPVVAITGKKKLTTTKARVKVKGTATGAVAAVQVKAGKKTVTAAGTTSWSAKVKVKRGVNKLTITATGPGGTSAPAKMTILRR